MYFVRLIPLPPRVEGVTLPNDDGTFDVYINARLPLIRQAEVLAHEIGHIRRGHFYDEAPAWENEAEIKKAPPVGGVGVRYDMSAMQI